MPLWPVYVQGWQFECCGEPFAVGERVAWRLVLHEDDFGLAGAPCELEGHPVPVPREDDECVGVAVQAGGLTAWWLGREAVPDPARVRGWLAEDHHADAPEGLPLTHGVVRRMQMVTQTFQDRGFQPAERVGAPELHDIDCLPRYFATGEGDVYAAQTGVLVDLDVEP